ncbi:hypothetical protein [Archaeoglobus sp.]
MRGLVRFLARRLKEEREEKMCLNITEIDRQIREIEEKYGMSYKEFYEHFESDISKLLENHDLKEVMDDISKLLELIDAKEKLTGRKIFDKLSEY